MTDWLSAIQALNAPSGSGWTNYQSYTDPATGQTYIPQVAYGQGQDGATQVLGYIAPKNNDTSTGNSYIAYDANGNYAGVHQFQAVNSTADFLTFLAGAAAIAFGPALLGFGDGAAAAAPLGTVDAASAVPLSASLGTGESVVVAGDAYLPGALGAGYTGLADGAVLPGLESYVLPLAATGTAAATASAASSTASTASSLASSAGTVSKLLAATGAVLGLVPAGAHPVAPGAAPPPLAYGSRINGVSDAGLMWLLIGAAALLVLKK